MENNDNKLQEQQAPVKNSDNAFVQVGHNGEPVMPQTDEKKNERSEKDEHTSTLDKR